ncbi:MAG TPA: O-antigen ligase family protein [Pyrinomonadaceae bacterium]|nr:O-antigen ligase family protein [Pyrinomonadaceae bacterium]
MSENTASSKDLLDRALTASLFLLALSAPISIAATQTAWAFGLLFWLIRFAIIRPGLPRHAFDLALLAFLGLTILSSFFSYEREVSLRKLVAVSLVTIVYLVFDGIHSRKTPRILVAILLVSGVVTVGYSLATLAIGKNLKIDRLSAESPLRAAGVEENDTILAADGVSVDSPEDLARIFSDKAAGDVVTLWIYHYELQYPRTVPVSSLPVLGDPVVRFGITEWTRGRDRRASGFFGHYTTYAEVIQLVLSLAFALLVLAPAAGSWRLRGLLLAAVIALSVGLFLTITRASWAGFVISAVAIILLGASRKTVLICLAISIPLVIGGLAYLQQKRNVAFIDTADGSTSWRMTVWREAVELLFSDPRHGVVGVGMDSIKTHHAEWGMFDKGRQPIGHLHSTPLQIAFERGLPALIAWMIWMFIYLKLLWNGLKRKEFEWPERAILLGVFGGTLGFLASGVVHYNWGDSEVVMIFYLLMGLTLAVLRQGSTAENPATA